MEDQCINCSQLPQIVGLINIDSQKVMNKIVLKVKIRLTIPYYESELVDGLLSIVDPINYRGLCVNNTHHEIATNY